MQNVIAEDRPEVGLSVVVLKTADRKSKILRVLAPLGVLLPNGLGLNVDGKDIGRAYFVRCFADGCYAEVVLEDELLKTFRSGASATFIVFQTPEEGIGIPVDLKGFAEGYDASLIVRDRDDPSSTLARTVPGTYIGWKPFLPQRSIMT
jgi:invasion protein IalB